MPDKSIIFSAPMIRALLEGRKTQTRRIVKLPHQSPLGKWVAGSVGGPGVTCDGEAVPAFPVIGHTRTQEQIGCPYGAPGDLIWVRETFKRVHSGDFGRGAIYRADVTGLDQSRTWKPGIHMFRVLSRLTSGLTDVRAQRAPASPEADALAGGGGGAVRM